MDLEENVEKDKPTNDIYATARILSRYNKRDAALLMEVIGASDLTKYDSHHNDITVSIQLCIVGEAIQQARRNALVDTIAACSIISTVAVLTCLALVYWK